MSYHQTYEQRQLLGQGSYGRCYLVLHRKEQVLYVAKRIRIEEFSKRRTALDEVPVVATQIEVMKCVKNPFVVSYKESFEAEDGVVIIMEYCQSTDGVTVEGDMKSVIEKCRREGKSVKEGIVKRWLLQLCIGLHYLHSRKILHRDLKPANILISNANTIKIGDFGTAKLLQGSTQMTNTIIGTYCYMSPEVCKQEAYGYESDLWALGCVMFELCNLHLPFQGRGIGELLFNIIQRNVRAFSSNYSAQLRSVVLSLLEVKASRPSLPKLMDEQIMVETLREEYSNHMASKTIADSQLFSEKEATEEPIAQEIRDEDFVLNQKLQLEETIQSISNFVESYPEAARALFASNKQLVSIPSNPSVMALSATFEDIEINFPGQFKTACFPNVLAERSRNLLQPPRLKFK